MEANAGLLADAGVCEGSGLATMRRQDRFLGGLCGSPDEVQPLSLNGGLVRPDQMGSTLKCDTLGMALTTQTLFNYMLVETDSFLSSLSLALRSVFLNSESSGDESAISESFTSKCLEKHRLLS